MHNGSKEPLPKQRCPKHSTANSTRQNHSGLRLKVCGRIASWEGNWNLGRGKSLSLCPQKSVGLKPSTEGRNKVSFSSLQGSGHSAGAAVRKLNFCFKEYFCLKNEQSSSRPCLTTDSWRQVRFSMQASFTWVTGAETWPAVRASVTQGWHQGTLLLWGGESSPAWPQEYSKILLIGKSISRQNCLPGLAVTAFVKPVHYLTSLVWQLHWQTAR